MDWSWHCGHTQWDVGEDEPPANVGNPGPTQQQAVQIHDTLANFFLTLVNQEPSLDE